MRRRYIDVDTRPSPRWRRTRHGRRMRRCSVARIVGGSPQHNQPRLRTGEPQEVCIPPDLLPFRERTSYRVSRKRLSLTPGGKPLYHHPGKPFRNRLNERGRVVRGRQQAIPVNRRSGYCSSDFGPVKPSGDWTDWSAMAQWKEGFTATGRRVRKRCAVSEHPSSAGHVSSSGGNAK